MATFSVVPDYGAEVEEVPNTDVVKFGDGYEQTQSVGINPTKKIWSLTFSLRSDTERDVILAFFRTSAGVTSFDWVDPEGSSGKYRCRKWKTRKDRFNLNTTTATFEQVYEP